MNTQKTINMIARTTLVVGAMCVAYVSLAIPSARASTIGSTISASTDSSLMRGLVGWWTMDGVDMVSNVRDRSGQGNNGFMKNFTSTSSAQVAGKVGQGFNFDGVDDYVNIGNPSAINTTIGAGSFSISSWIKTSDSRGLGALVMQKYFNGFQFSLVTGAYPSFNIYDGSGATEVAYDKKINDGQWHHIVLVRDRSAGNINIYVDTARSSHTTVDSTTDLTSSQPLVFGQPCCGNSYFVGSLDDVRIYNRALSVTEIRQLYGMGGAQKVGTSDTNTSNGLVGHWTFDGKDMLTNVADTSGQGKHGFMKNFTSTSSAQVAGKVGQGLKFDGVDDYVRLSDTTGGDMTTNNFSVSLWLKTNTTATTQYRLLSKRGSEGYELYLASGFNSLGAYIDGTPGAVNDNDLGTANARDMKWHHAVVVFDRSGNMTGYLDGQVGSSPSSLAPVTGSVSVNNQVYFGQYSNGGGDFFDGSLDDVRIYNRALSATEVRQLYNQTVGDKVAVTSRASSGTGLAWGLVGHWTFDGPDMLTNVADRSGQGNHGKFVGFGATSTAVTPGKLGQALKLDGVNDAVDTTVTPFNFERTDPFSTSLWFKIEQLPVGVTYTFLSNYGSPGWFVGPGAASTCGTGPTAKIGFLMFAGSQELVVCISSTPAYGVWHHLATTYDGSVTVGGVKIYIDGVSQSIGTSHNNLASSIVSSYKLRIGDDRTGDWTKGSLDDVRIYNRVLSAAEVKQLYSMGK